MAKTLQYWGTGNFQEHPYTGRIVTWTEKEKQTVDDAIATKLLASGAGFVLDNDETGEVVTSRIDPVTGGIESLTAGGQKVVDLQYGDNLTTPSTTTTLTAAISTTATLSATASGTYRKARVSWINNGASASAKLYMSINADNDVQGMSACNSSRRRDHEMTMGDCIMLVCDTPITRINFTSDTSIASNTHRLMVTFGE